MKSHEIDYEIIGDDIQFVEIELDTDETVIAEAGTMMYMKNGIVFETKMGDGSKPNEGFMSKLLSAASRKITGESIFLTHFTHKGTGKGHVAFAAPYPGTIIPIDLAKTGTIIAQRDAFLCAALGTKLSMHLNQNIGSGLFGGEGFILQKIEGDGKVFIQAGGTIVEKELNDEKIRIDTGCIVAFENTINYSIEKSGNLKSMFFGGEGLFLATLQGTGKIWLQSMPIGKLIRAISPHGANRNSGESRISMLNKLFEN